MIAVAVCAAGVELLVLAQLGLDPLTNFEYAISCRLQLSLGRASLLFEGLTFLFFFFANRELVKFGSFAFCFGIGPCIDFWAGALERLTAGCHGWIFQTLCLLLGSILITASIAYYVPLNYGLQSLDMYSVSLASIMKKSYGAGLTVTYGVLILMAALLGVYPGIATFLAMFVYGSVIDGMRRLLKRRTK